MSVTSSWSSHPPRGKTTYNELSCFGRFGFFKIHMLLSIMVGSEGSKMHHGLGVEGTDVSGSPHFLMDL